MEIVQVFLDHFFERSDLIEALKGVYDLERLASRVSFGKAVPVDFCSWLIPYQMCLPSKIFWKFLMKCP